MVEIYRPRLAVPVPQAEDVVAVASHNVAHVDVNDERSLAAAVRDAVAEAQPVPRSASLTTSHGTVVGVTDVAAMSWLQVVVLSVVQGLTEFLPVSARPATSRSCRRCSSRDDAGASFTAVTQLGTETGGADLLRPRHRPHPRGLVRRTARRRAPHRPITGWAGG